MCNVTGGVNFFCFSFCDSEKFWRYLGFFVIPRIDLVNMLCA